MTPAHHEVVARNPEKEPQRSLPDDAAANCSRLFAVFRRSTELTARIIEGRKEMVQQIGPDDAVDAFDTKTFGELAQGKRCNGQVLNGPVADGE